MPPVLQLSSMNSTPTKRLGFQYPPSQGLNTSQSQLNGGQNGQHALPERPASLTPNSQGFPSPRRSLPTKDVTDVNFDDAYVNFIMYCNPTVPPETDTTELRKTFRGPPKSDGKNFNTFTLFELIRKLDQKEIKTWAQLAIDLGVEPPSVEKGQSAQKVQQYAVRLKRWMHAMHVDAFFEFLLNKPHVYYSQVPPVNDPSSEFGRDGVAPEEDLALRALLPETRPKRGRRKAEDKDESDTGKSPSQRPRIDSPTLSEDFMMARTTLIEDNTAPSTAHPDFQQSFNAPWSAIEHRGPASAVPGSTFRWPPIDSHQTLSGYPKSAITPTTRTHLWNDANEPCSAITPKNRSRRRHGPAVSSAWPSNGGMSSGKLRGRPPSNRSVQDGPFSTFPVNHSSRDVPTINLRDNTPTATPIADKSNVPHFFPTGVQVKPLNPQVQSGLQNGRPGRLQLQVPQREGGAVRLATPPPQVLVNAPNDTDMSQDLLSNPQHINPMMEHFISQGDQDPNFPGFVSIAFRQNEDTDRTNMDTLESHFMFEILSANWFDGAGNSIERCSFDEADKICKQVIKNLQAESSSTEAFLINLSALAGGPLMTRLRMTRRDQGTISHYECHWKMRFGSIEGDFTIRATVHHGVDSAALEHGPEEPEESWKKRYLDLRQQIQERDAVVGKLKRSVMDALVVTNRFTSL